MHVRHVEDSVLDASVVQLTAQPDYTLRRHTLRPEVDGTQSRAFDLFVITTDVLAVALQDVEFVAEHLGPRKREEVAGVGVLRDQPQRLPLAHAPDHDRRVRPTQSL